MSVFKRRRFPVEIILLCVRWYEGLRSDSWRVDRTYVRVGRDTRAATRFLGKALKIMKDCPPSCITRDKLASYPKGSGG